MRHTNDTPLARVDFMHGVAITYLYYYLEPTDLPNQ